MRQTAARVPDVAEAFWSYLARKAGIPPSRSQKVWRAIRHSPEVTTWRYVLDQALRAPVWPPPDPLRRGPCRPGQVVDALEWAVTQRRLTRADATAVEEALLRLIDRDGVWK